MFLKKKNATSPDTPSYAGSYVTSRRNQPSNFCGPPMANGLGESGASLTVFHETQDSGTRVTVGGDSSPDGSDLTTKQKKKKKQQEV